MPIFICVVVIILVLILANIKVVPQSTECVVEFLGKYKTTWGAGLHVKIPVLEAIVKKVSLKECLLDSPPQPVITRDNVTMQIDSVVYYYIYDAKLYTYGATNPVLALANLAATTLRNVVGEMDLDNTLTSRDNINQRMTQVLDEATDKWGIKVTRVELKNIIPPKEIQSAMEKQMKAERERRETLLQAEGHKAAAITRAEGDKQAMILAAEGERDARIARAEGEAKALRLAKEAEAAGLMSLKTVGVDASVLELKRYETLMRLADGKAAKIIIPTDVVTSVKNHTVFNEVTGLGDVTKPDMTPEVIPEKPDACCGKPSPDDECCFDEIDDEDDIK